jgi:hypothetical protein
VPSISKATFLVISEAALPFISEAARWSSKKMQGGRAKAKPKMQDGRAKNVRLSSKKMQGGRAKVKQKMQDGRAKNARWPSRSFF